jgi:ubiquitin-like 1-activating enzyme E1 A
MTPLPETQDPATEAVTEAETEATETPAASSKSAAPTESDVYDRQIRLWGAEAQSKMSSAKVLYINTSGISSEILKNLVLAGIHASIADGRIYPDAMIHTPSSFLPPSERLAKSVQALDNNEKIDENEENGEGDSEQEPSTKKMKKMTVAKAMAPYVHELNPLLPTCEINEEENIESIPIEFLQQFDIIIASQISLKEALYIQQSATSASMSSFKAPKFYFVHSFGFYACAIMDLFNNHEYRKEVGKELSDIHTISKDLDYLPLKEMIGLKLSDVKDRWHKNGPPLIYAKFRCIFHYYESKNKEWPDESNVQDFIAMTKKFLVDQGLKDDYVGNDEELEGLCRTANAEVSPVCAVMGGVLGNEVIKAISGRGEPANNILLFDGLDGGCKSFTLKKP